MKVRDDVSTGKGKQGELGKQTYTGFNERYFEGAGSQWADCPGCDKCDQNDGYILRRGAWRCTKSHEYLFMLAKSERYFCDAEAVREDSVDPNDDRKSRVKANHKDFQREGNLLAAGSQTYPKRNKRTVWTIPTAPYSGAHFATFPPALVEPCIKAGTSKRGCCPECGAQFARVVERKSMVIDRSERTHELGRTRSSGTMVEQPTSTTLGWRQTCDHDHEPIPCTVFDPFAGSGTTLLVARALGRNGVGIDLSGEYLQQARERLSLDKLDAWSNGSKRVDDSVLDLPLFGEL